MNTVRMVEQIKEVMMKELLRDINDKYCVLDLYIESNGKSNQKLSEMSQAFLKSKKAELIDEYGSGRIIFFRKYNYEKIMNQYLESKYNVANIEFDLFPSDRKRQEIEEKYKQDLKEQQYRESEQNIIKQIPCLKWEKTVRLNSVVYTATDNNGKKINLRHVRGNANKNKKMANKLIYDNQPLKYVEYDVESVVSVIEKTHPKNVKADNIIVVTRNKRPKDIIKPDNIDNKNQYRAFVKAKEQYIKVLAKEYGIKQQDIDGLSVVCENECKHLKISKDKNTTMFCCTLFDRPCCIFFSDCPYNQHFLNILIEEKRKRLQFKPESISVLAKRYNTTSKNVKSIAGTFKCKCAHYVHGKCTLEQIPFSNCSLQNCDCVFHNEFMACMKKHSEKILQKQKNVQNEIKVSRQKKTGKSEQLLPEIGLSDFVVRTNVFKCMHNKHIINNVDAMINIDEDGKKKQIKISAGYCSQCKVYFILDSTYQRLKGKGMILCRVTDEKHYMKSGYINGMKLAQESLLMQYGYNVSKTEGLSSTSRQKILAVIIDNKIMAKSEIISYLDFFISQRSSLSNMEIAISKWESDREFVENYKIGQYTQFGVNAIYRR